MAATAFQKKLQDIQLKISESELAAAQARQAKAEVELETAKMHQEFIRKSYEMEFCTKSGNGGGGIKS